jgi:protein-tyrosine-phosphatase
VCRVGAIDHNCTVPDAAGQDIPDPWSGTDADYDHALDLIEQVADGILRDYPSGY